MKTIVLYVSKMGATKAYAEELAKLIGGDAMPLKKFRWKKGLGAYDCFVFGGWVMGGKIQGIDTFLSHYDEMNDAGKDIIVFSCGMSHPTPEGRKEMISINVLDLYRVRYYQVQGSFDFQKLKFPWSMMMKFTLNKMEADPNLDDNKKALLSFRERPLIVHDEAKIEKIARMIGMIAAERDKKSA